MEEINATENWNMNKAFKPRIVMTDTYKKSSFLIKKNKSVYLQKFFIPNPEITTFKKIYLEISKQKTLKNKIKTHKNREQK